MATDRRRNFTLADLSLETSETTREIHGETGVATEHSEVDEKVFPRSGWGIIKNSGGLSRMSTLELVEVVKAEEEAGERAKNLNEVEGYSHPMEGGDIEDEFAVFYAQEVTLKGITKQVTFRAEYETVEGKPE